MVITNTPNEGCIPQESSSLENESSLVEVRGSPTLETTNDVQDITGSDDNHRGNHDSQPYTSLVSQDTIPSSQVLLSQPTTLSQADSGNKPEDNMRRLFARLIGHKKEYSTLTDEYVKLMNEKGVVTLEYGAPLQYKVCYSVFVLWLVIYPCLYMFLCNIISFIHVYIRVYENVPFYPCLDPCL